MAREQSNLSRFLWRSLTIAGTSCLLIVLVTAAITRGVARRHAITYRLAPDEGPPGPEALEQAAAILHRRVDVLTNGRGLRDLEIAPQPEGKLRLSFSTRSDPETLLFWLAMRGRAELRLLHPEADILNTADPDDLPEGYDLKTWQQDLYRVSRPGELRAQEHRYLVARRPLLTVDRFESVRFDTVGLHKKTVLTFQFGEADAERFHELTALNVGRRMAMLIDGRLFFPPKQIQSAIEGGTVQMQGFFYNPPLRKLIKILQIGALPGELEELSPEVQ